LYTFVIRNFNISNLDTKKINYDIETAHPCHKFVESSFDAGLNKIGLF